MVTEERIGRVKLHFATVLKTYVWVWVRCKFIGWIIVMTLGARAQVPASLSFQGRVTVSGVPFDGPGRFKLALVNTAGSVTYWSNDGSSVAGSEPAAAVPLTVIKGLYNVPLGNSTLPNMSALPATVFANPEVALRVWFEDGTHGFQRLLPDQRLASVAYAWVAKTAETATTATTAQSVASPPGMVLVPAGTFTMGDSTDFDFNAIPTRVDVSAFYIDVYEVSWSQWQSVHLWAIRHGYESVNAGAGKGPNHPVQMVNWFDCVKWCNAKSEQAGKPPVYYSDPGLTAVYRSGEDTVYPNWNVQGYRLPTEAEWEKAARGGWTGQRFPWGNVVNQNLANYQGAVNFYYYDLGPDGLNPTGSVGGTTPATTPIGLFAANGFGLYDMTGNVWEWCWDWFGTPYAGGRDPHGASTGLGRIYRGGSWNYFATNCRLSYRLNNFPVYKSHENGLRVVLSLGPP